MWLYITPGVQQADQALSQVLGGCFCTGGGRGQHAHGQPEAVSMPTPLLCRELQKMRLEAGRRLLQLTGA